MTLFDKLSDENQIEIENQPFRYRNNLYEFPKSYLEFSSKLGYGLFCNLFIIYPPFNPIAGCDCDSFNERMNTIRGFIDCAVTEEYIDYYPDGSEDLAEYLIPFGASENGEYLCWDIRTFKNGEYPIYIIGTRMAAVTYGAKDLYELTEKLTSDAVKTILGISYDALPLSFKRYKHTSEENQ